MGNDKSKKAEENIIIDDPAVIKAIIKKNVLPTIAVGTTIFCTTMFVSGYVARLFSFDIWSWLALACVYFTIWIIEFKLAIKRLDGPAMFFLYTGSAISGFVQYPIILYADEKLGGMIKVAPYFAMAVLCATAVIVALTIVHHTYPKLFYVMNSGSFLRWLVIFGLMSISMWLMASTFMPIDAWLFWEALGVICLFGFYTIYDLGKLQILVAEGRWVFATTSLILDYFVLIIRFFNLLVSGQGSHSSK